MLRQPRAMRPIAGAVTLAVAVVLSANCVTAKDMTPEQKACCAAMGHDCGALAIEQGCCEGEAQKVDALTPTGMPQFATPPVAVLVALLDPLTPRAIPTGVFNTAVGAQVKPPGTPTYLLVSTFRI